MASLKAIRKRIVSVKNTRKITRAMKLVAAAKLRRAQDTIIAARPYSSALASVVSELSGVAGKDAHPLFEEREAKRASIVVIYAGTNGFVDDYPVSVIGRYERELMSFIKSRKQSLLDEVKSTGKLEGDSEKQLRDALTEFAKQFSTDEKKS